MAVPVLRGVFRYGMQCCIQACVAPSRAAAAEIERVLEVVFFGEDRWNASAAIPAQSTSPLICFCFGNIQYGSALGNLQVIPKWLLII